MESYTEFKETEISTLDFVSEDAVRYFTEFNVLTVGHLLSATRGLTTPNLFIDLQDGKELLEAFLEILPDELLKVYSEYNETHPTGLLKPKDNEDQS